MKREQRGTHLKSDRILTVLFLVAVTVSFVLVNQESPEATTSDMSIDGQVKPCGSAAQRQEAKTDTRVGQYSPVYSTRSVPRLDPNGRKYIGFHRWCETNASTHGLQWVSDAANAMNDFIVCRYIPSAAAKEVNLDFGGGRIEFANKDGSGKGDVLFLAVYEGTPPPASLFRGNEINFGKALIKKWTKVEKVSTLQIEPIRRTFRANKEITVVLVGVDPWIDTRVMIQIDHLKLYSRSLSGK